MSLEQSVARMRGPVNTPVTLTIERAKQSEPIQLSLVRETVKAVPVKGRLEGDVGLHQDFNVQPTNSTEIA